MQKMEFEDSPTPSPLLRRTLRPPPIRVVAPLLLLATCALLSLQLDVSSTWNSTFTPNRVSAYPSIYYLEEPSITKNLRRCFELCFKVPQREDWRPENSACRLEKEVWESYKGSVEPMPAGNGVFPYQQHYTGQFQLSAILGLRLKHLPQSPPPTLESADFIYLALDTSLVPCFPYNRCPDDANPETIEFRARVEKEVLGWIEKTVTRYKGRRNYPSLILSLSRPEGSYYRSLSGTSWREKAGLDGNLVFVGIERFWEATEVKQVVDEFITLPYPTSYHLPVGGAGAQGEAAIKAWFQAQEPRKYLLVLAGRVSVAGTHGGAPVRQALHDSLFNSTDPRIFLATGSEFRLWDTYSAMLSSTFCLQPPGDSPTRRGAWDSVQLGCIPVLFRSGSYKETSWGAGNGELERLAIVVNEAEIIAGVGGSIVQRLDAIGQEELAWRKEGLVALARMSQYSVPRSLDGGPQEADAVGRMLALLGELKSRAEEAAGVEL